MSLRRFRSEEDAPPTLGERMVMAILAPIMFNISLLLMFSAFFRRSRFLGKTLLYPGAYSSAWLIGCLLIGVPALIGFWFGVNRCATLLGHFFYSNMEHERSLFKTALAWGGLFLIAFLLSRLF